MFVRILKSIVGLIILATAWPSQASAEAADTLRLDEVSVSAIKGVSAQLDMEPVAATVIGRTEAERLNILTLRDAGVLVPNFVIPDYGTRVTSAIYVRGIGSRMDESVVGMTVDNVPLLNKAGYDFDIQDIDRIEILRGPQATLYGRNAMAGQVNVSTLSPMTWQGSRIMGEIGSGRTSRIYISHYEKFKPTLAMSFGGGIYYQGGFFTNEYLGYPADRSKGASLRWKTVWHLRHDVAIENTAAFALTRDGGYPYAYAESGDINYNDTCFYRRNMLTDGLTIQWKPGPVTLTSITSAQYVDDNMTLDQDFLPLDYFTLTQRRHEYALTEDLMAKGKRGDWSHLTGVFGMYRHTWMDAPVRFKDRGIAHLIEDKRNQVNPDYPIHWDSREMTLGSTFTTPTWGLAIYHTSTYDVGPVTLTGGVRLDYERATLHYASRANTGYTVYDPKGRPFAHKDIDIDDGASLSRHFLEFVPKVTAMWRLDRTGSRNVYVSVGKGYKAGGFNTQMFSDVLQQRIMGMMGLGMDYAIDDVVGYAPEKSWDYELGAHMSWLNGRLTAQAALFYIDCRDQQITTFPDGTGTGRITSNAGRTRSRGAEVAVRWTPVERLDLSASWGFTDARFMRYDNGRNNYAGRRVPYAPRNTLFGSATYRQPVSNGWLREIIFNANTRAEGSIVWDEANMHKQPFYGQLGGSVAFSGTWYEVSVWGENLTNARFDTFSFVSLGNTFYQRGKPRRWGITLRVNL